MKSKASFILLVFLLVTTLAKAQDILTVMQYNLLEYGNYNSGFASCFETNNNTQHKDECIRTILDYVKPDILTVNEFGSTDALQNDFLRHNLNINGVDWWQSDNRLNYANSNIINHIFFDSRKMGLKRRVALRTNPRDTDVYELYMKTAGLAAGDTIKLVCIVAHLKAGMGYESSRRACLQTAMDYVNQHYPTDNVLIMGDFNMYSSNESGYKLLTQTYNPENIRFVDPLGSAGVGEWHENSQYAPYHTQATLYWTDNDCRSGGGLDDRFDFILMADEIAFGYNRVRYVSNSYKAVGNDGQHFNQSIDIDLCFREMVGPDAAADFWKAFKDNYVTRDDIRFIAECGANTIRLPFNYRLFTDEDYMGLSSDQDGFRRIDDVVSWCREFGLYLILDMHDAPGGQTGDNIDDGYGYPWLFESERSQQLFCDIWKRIAERYSDEPVILGYELMNEPIATYFDDAYFNPMLEPLYKRAVAAILFPRNS